MKLKNAQVFCGADGFIEKDVCFGKYIEEFKPGEDETVDCNGMYLLPGFIDIHTHGAFGVEADKADAAGIKKLAGFYASHGTTSFAPTCMTLPEDDMIRFAKLIADYEGSEGEASIQGINLEGPFLSEKKRGAHNPEYLREPDIDMLKRIHAASDNNIKIITIAPELNGAMEFISEAKEICRVSIGHTACDYETAEAAFDKGASQLTHIFNAMEPFLHRDPGPIAAAYDKDAYVELICDGIHVHPEAVKMVFELFEDHVILISDSLSCAGLGDGVYSSGDMDVYVRDGKATIKDGNLAGSLITISDAVRNAVKFGVDFKDAVYATTVNPAKALGIYGRKGVIRPGADADLILMNQNYDICKVFIGGKEV